MAGIDGHTKPRSGYRESADSIGHQPSECRCSAAACVSDIATAGLRPTLAALSQADRAILASPSLHLRSSLGTKGLRRHGGHHVPPSRMRFTHWTKFLMNPPEEALIAEEAFKLLSEPSDGLTRKRSEARADLGS